MMMMMSMMNLLNEKSLYYGKTGGCRVVSSGFVQGHQFWIETHLLSV